MQKAEPPKSLDPAGELGTDTGQSDLAKDAGSSNALEYDVEYLPGDGHESLMAYQWQSGFRLEKEFEMPFLFVATDSIIKLI